MYPVPKFSIILGTLSLEFSSENLLHLQHSYIYQLYIYLNHPFLLFVSRLSCSKPSRCIPKRTINFETLVGGGEERSEPLCRLQRTCYRLLKLEELPAERGGGSLRGLCTCVHDSTKDGRNFIRKNATAAAAANLITLMRDRTRKSRYKRERKKKG